VRARRSVGFALTAHAAVLWSASAISLLFRHEIVRFFSDEPHVIRFGAEYLLFSAASFALYGVYLALFRALQGAGDMTATMLISLGSAIGVAAPLGYSLATRTTLGPRGTWTAGGCTRPPSPSSRLPGSCEGDGSGRAPAPPSMETEAKYHHFGSRIGSRRRRARIRGLRKA
jgi:hypothetical protein